MMVEEKLQQVEEGLFLALRDDVLRHLGATEGDTLVLTILGDAAIHLRKAKPESQQQEPEEGKP